MSFVLGEVVRVYVVPNRMWYVLSTQNTVDLGG